MSDNYYDSLISHIESLIHSGDYSEARKLIEEELSMPFVPAETLKKLETLKIEVDSQLNQPKPQRMMSPQEVRQALVSGGEKAYKALEVLAMSNIRSYLPVLSELLESSQINHVLKAFLIELMNSQQISNLMSMVDNGKVITFIPSQLPTAITQKNFMSVQQQLERYIPSNPSFLQQAKMVLVNVAYDRYPYLIKDDEIENIAFSIIRYVYLAYGDEAGCQQFLQLHHVEENQLEEYGF